MQGAPLLLATGRRESGLWLPQRPRDIQEMAEPFKHASRKTEAAPTPAIWGISAFSLLPSLFTLPNGSSLLLPCWCISRHAWTRLMCVPSGRSLRTHIHTITLSNPRQKCAVVSEKNVLSPATCFTSRAHRFSSPERCSSALFLPTLLMPFLAVSPSRNLLCRLATVPGKIVGSRMRLSEVLWSKRWLAAGSKE